MSHIYDTLEEKQDYSQSQETTSPAGECDLDKLITDNDDTL